MSDDSFFGVRSSPKVDNIQRWRFAATEGQTVISGLSYTPGYVDLMVNGSELVTPDDFTATDGTTITVTAPLSGGDIVKVVAFKGLYMADIYSKSQVDGLVGSERYTTAGGTANALTATFASGGTLTDGFKFRLKTTTANTSSTATMEVIFGSTSTGAKSLKGFNNSTLLVGQVTGEVVIRYNLAGDRFEVVGSSFYAGGASRSTLSGTAISAAAMDLNSYGAFDWTISGNSTIAFPTSVPSAGSWYIDTVVNATGGYTITWASGYTTSYGYYFDCLPNARYRFWLVARSASAIDVSVERVA